MPADPNRHRAPAEEQERVTDDRAAVPRRPAWWQGLWVRGALAAALVLAMVLYWVRAGQ